jgi:hypothetical protein
MGKSPVAGAVKAVPQGRLLVYPAAYTAVRHRGPPGRAQSWDTQ